VKSSLWPAIAIGVILAGGGGLLVMSRQEKPALQAAPVNASEHGANASGVGCTGHVEPENGMIVVAAAPALGRTPVIAKLMVEEGQMVATGQTIAVLAALPDLESAVQQAEARVAVAQSHLAQLSAGARSGDVLALQSDIARMEIEAKAAKQDLDRQEALLRKDFIPRVQVEAARLKSENADGLLEAARHRLESLTDVRASDTNPAKAELVAAEADRDRARVEESAATIRSPANARVMRIVAHAGEAVGPGGVVTLADTNRMSVIAEVYETDIARVRVGQKAMIRSESFPDPLEGVVGWISPQIENLSTPAEPSQSPDQRVYQARIDVKNPKLLAQRIHAKVSVLIEP
jgi:HlyD family secretion protein